MICQGPLTKLQMKQSQRNYLLFGAVNGASYMCFGETVIILFAIHLNASNSLIAVLGSMNYFGYLLLPLGKWMTARVGAAQSQATFWQIRNAAAGIVILAAPVALWGNHLLAMILLSAGVFLFQGFRAAGVVMCQPLLGEICEPEVRGRVISLYTALFYGFGIVSLLVITFLLKFHSSIWMLTGVIAAGIAMGGVAAGFISKICETGQIRDSARLPLRRNLRQTCADRSVRRQLVAGVICNLMLILTLPISVLAVKKGFHFSDIQTLLCSLLQFLVMVGGSFMQARLADRLGARKLLICGYWSLLPICFGWLLIPAGGSPWWGAIPFVFCGIAGLTLPNAMTFYFLNTVRKELQVVASILIAVATGVLSGLAGMVCGTLLLKMAENTGIALSPLGQFHWYFGMVLMLVLLGGITIHRLP